MTISIDPATAAITLLMAIGLIGLGWWQIGALRQQINRIDESATLTERASRAELIVRLNAVYDDILKARRDVWNMVQACTKVHPTDPAKCYREVSNKLAELRTSDKEEDLTKYYDIHRILDFGELVGFLVIDRNLLTIDDIKGLWGTSLKAWAKWLGVHITDLQQEYSDAYVLLLKLAEKL